MLLFKKIKEYLNQNQNRLIIIIAFTLIGFIGFGLGVIFDRLSYQKPIKIEYSDISDLFKEKSVESKKFIASKQGKFYYPENCPASSILKPENIIEFLSSQQAEDFGYEKSKECNNK